MKSRNYYVELVLDGEPSKIKEFVSANSKGILLLSDVQATETHPSKKFGKHTMCRTTIGVTNVEPWVRMLCDAGIRITNTRIRVILDSEWLEVLRTISLLNLEALKHDR